MRSGRLQRPLLSLLAALAFASIAAADADAAEPVVSQLPDATHAYSLAPGADGSVWFAPGRGSAWTGPSGQILGALRTDGTVDEISAPGFENPTSDPTGEVWVSGERPDAAGESTFVIGRLTAAGQIEEQHVVGKGRGRIKEIAVARGAIWFSRRSADGRESIERLSLADGGVRRFVLQKTCEVRAIAAGEDGTLWFTEVCRRYLPSYEYRKTRTAIGRISRGGKIVRHRLAPSDPFSIAVGRNGSVWVGISHNGFSSDFVARVTKAGTLVKYVIRGYPDSIAVGPEGRVWFESSFKNGDPALASITPSGKRELRCAEPTCALEPTDLAIAPDGSLWYGLTRPNWNQGGGGAGLIIANEIANEPGAIGHLAP